MDRSTADRDSTWPGSRISVVTGAFSFVGGLVALAGWVFGLEPLKDWSGVGISMKTNTALCASAAGIGVWLLGRGSASPARRRVVRALGGFTLGIGLLTLSEHMLGWNLGIDALLFTEPVGERGTMAPNRMGPPASTSFVFVGVALILLAAPRARLRRLADALGTGVLCISSLSLIGYLYGASELFAFARFTGIALQTAVMLHALGWGLLALCPGEGIAASFRSSGPGGLLVRRLVPIAIALPLALGFASVSLAPRGFYDFPFASAVVGLVTILTLTGFLIQNARAIDREALERRTAEAALAQSEARYRVAFEQAPVGVMELETDTIRILRANEAYAKILGRPLAQIIGHTPTEFTYPDDLPGDALAAAAVQAGQRLHLHKRYQRPDGSLVWVNVAGRGVIGEGGARRTIAIVADVTAEVEAAATVRESEERFRASLHGSPTCVYMNDTQLRYVWIYNPLPGFRAEDMIGKRDEELLPPASVAELVALKREVLATGKGQRRQIDTEIAGELAAFDVKAEPRLDGGGRVVGLLVSASNITPIRVGERHREQLLVSERAAREQAERAARSRDDFIAVISHELRTPLNNILGWSHVLKKASEEPEARTEAVDAIVRAVHAQAHLLEDLLDMNRVVSGKLRLDVRSVEPMGVVEAALDTVRPAANAKQIRIVTVLDPTAGPVMGDAERLQQIVWNLLSNAVKFTPRDGRVEVHLRRGASHAEIIVSDDGAGIPEDQLPHVFDRYYQGDSSISRRHSGLGLGLAIARSLVELHGGTLSAYSAGTARGSTFTVAIPLAQPQEAAASPESASAAAEGPSLAGIRALVVDDDLDSLEVARRVLSERGAEVETAASGPEALRRIAVKPPHVLLSDVGMPEMDGYELIRLVRAGGSAVPAVAITAFARPDDRIRALQAGYDMHISKPYDPRELLTIVAAVTRGVPKGPPT